MIEVKIPKDIKNYKEKFMMNLTLRQFISFALSIFIMLPLFITGVFKWHWNQDVVGWLVLLIGGPVISIGFINYNGMTAEKFVLQWIKTNVIYPQKRIYKIKNPIRELVNYVEPQKRKKDNVEREKNKNSSSKDSSKHNSLPVDII